MEKARSKIGSLFLVVALMLLVWGQFEAVSGRTNDQKERPFRLEKVTATPNPQNFTHRVSNVWLTITNWGFFGSKMQDATIVDCETQQAAPSCQFPAGSNLEYLFQGAMWFGAVIAGDTLVSTGTDGWWDIQELYPDEASSITGRIWLRSTRPSSAYPRNRTDCYPDQIDSSSAGSPEAEKFGTEAISEEDFVSAYTDTHTASFVETDPVDARPHRPLGLEIVQKSYAWSYEYAEDFFLMDIELTNISDRDIEQLWAAFHVDADVQHISKGSNGAQDDMTGFLVRYPAIEGIDSLDIFTAYIADVDGDPTGGVWDHRSVRGLSGVRVVRSPSETIGFNWWISNINAAFDWGPQRADNYRIYADGNMGTPTGDPSRYYAISNGEFDYDQMTCALNHEAEGWLPPLSPSGNAKDIANGFDTRYTYSFGPFATLPPDSTLKVTVGYICGADFHVRPDDAEAFIASPDDPAVVEQYHSRLDFADFAINATWAGWVFDNPGVDTDTNGYRGEYVLSPEGDTVWIQGDGVPDFAGPPPPPSPQLSFRISPGVVSIIWNSLQSENSKDTFSGLNDFEGYKVYWSRTGRLDDYDLLAGYDYIDYDSTYHESGRLKKWKEAPIRYQALKEKHPNIDFYKFPPYAPMPPYDTLFTPHSYNRGFGDTELDSAFLQSGGGEVILDSTTIHIDQTTGDSTNVRWYSKTYTNLLESQPLYFAVTSYDYGNPVTNLSPIESSRAINATLLYPTATGEDITGEVFVFPNPYRIDGGYADAGFEDPDQSGWTPWDRRIYFGNLPEKCTIRIFTLDGDLVDTIEYDRSLPGTLEFAAWGLISRNTQAVVSGLYIFSVESETGNYLGKFVIIK
jgi:hypothetical protein